MTLLLSNELKLYAEQLEREYAEDLSPEEREEAQSTKQFVSDLAKFIVLSREILVQDPLAQLDSFVQEHKDTVERLLDEHYVLQQIENVPDLVRRTLQLSQLNARSTPSRQTNRYISEASKAYIQGFPLASVAMSRAALEQALKERLGMQGDQHFYMLKNLLEEALKWNLLSPTGFYAARDLAKKCDAVLHERPVENEKEALTILSGVRSLLEEIYSSDGHY
jgi:hypothetical protein